MIKVNCIVIKELKKQKKLLTKRKWIKLRDKLQKEYCIEESCLLCPLLKLKEEK